MISGYIQKQLVMLQKAILSLNILELYFKGIQKQDRLKYLNGLIKVSDIRAF